MCSECREHCEVEYIDEEDPAPTVQTDAPTTGKETPRTDEREYTMTIKFRDEDEVRKSGYVPADFARQLERELNAMSAESQRNREAGQEWAARYHKQITVSDGEARHD